MVWIALPKDKESTYDTTWEVYKQIQNVINALKKLWKPSKILQTKVYPNAPNT
jgi:hypothetical protein